MNPQDTSELNELLLDEHFVLNDICLRFELAWKNCERPHLDDYCTGGSSLLFKELLFLDVEYREKLGEEPSRSEYSARFPDQSEAISSVWRSLQGETQRRPSSDTWRSPPEITDYEIIRELGRGGMGVVYLARQTRLDRLVALKTILAAAPGTDTVARFEREARATAAIAHDNIVTIYEVGEHNGVPYLAMQYLEGETLDARLKDASRQLTFAESLRIAGEIASGLAAAHSHGLVHRDVKPANIWLEAGSGRVKIMDFGLVHSAVTTQDVEKITRDGWIIGTPAYMAPEQAGRHPVDTRADLFSLGCILYRMTSGHLPFGGADPLSILRSVALDRPSPLHKLNPLVPRGFSDLVMQLLAKDPQDRPSSAKEVVQRLETVSQPKQLDLRAGGGRPRQFRNRWIAASIVGLLLVAGLVRAAQIIITIRNKDGTETVLEVPKGSEVRVRENGEEHLFGKLRPLRTWKPGESPFDKLRRENIAPYELKAAGKPEAVPSGLVAILGSSRFRHGNDARAIAFSPDGTRVASGGSTSVVRIWDVATGEELVQCRGHVRIINTLAYSPNGKILASGTNSGRSVKIWDAASGREVETLKGHADFVTKVAFSPDETSFASADRDGTVVVRETATWETRHVLRGHAGAVNDIAFDSDGTRLATAGEDQTVRVYSVLTGQELLRLDDIGHAVVTVDFSPDANRLVTGESGDKARVWDLETRQSAVELKFSSAGRRTARFTPRGRVATSFKGYIAVWNVMTGNVERHFRTEGGLFEIDFSADGRKMASAGHGGRIRVFDLETGEPLLSPNEHYSPIVLLAVSADGRRLASQTRFDSRIHVWDTSTGTQLFNVPTDAHYHTAVRMAFSADGRRLASTDRRGAVIFDGTNGQKRRTLRGDSQTLALAYSPDNERLARAYFDGTVKIWDTAKGIESGAFAVRQNLTRIAFSPNGKLLAGGASPYGHLGLWDADTGEEVAFLDNIKFRYCPTDFAFSPDNRYLAFGSFVPRRLVIFDCVSGKEHLNEDRGFYIPGLAFSPDGKMLATGGDKGRLVLWSFPAMEQIKVQQINVPISSIVFAPDGRHLIVGNGNGTIFVLRLE